ncbi:MAG: hypothetical protein Q7J72_06910 [Candidatus Omnitrophota bacterium]|nr:hypothetical protein [Candidatus Omnitrophota bacterium]
MALGYMESQTIALWLMALAILKAKPCLPDRQALPSRLNDNYKN